MNFEDLADVLLLEITQIITTLDVKQLSELSKESNLLMASYLWTNLSNDKIPLKLIKKYGKHVRTIVENGNNDFRFAYLNIRKFCPNLKLSRSTETIYLILTVKISKER